MTLEPPRATRVPYVIVDMYVRWLHLEQGVPLDRVLTWIMPLLRGCQSRN